MMQWVKPEDRTPEVDRWVLVIRRWYTPITYEPYIGYIDEWGHWFSKDTGEPMDVAFWAEIPNIPQEDE